MADSSDLYLCFEADHIFYIVSVMDVERICAAEEVEDDSQLQWPDLGRSSVNRDRETVILLQAESERYALCADEIEGVIKVDPEDQFEVPTLLQKQYPWILGVSIQRDRERLMLLIDTPLLRELVGDEAEQGE